RSADGDLRRLEVTRLAHEDDVGVLAQKAAERTLEGTADLVVDLELVDPLEVVLDRILRGHDVDFRRVDGVDRRVQGRRLAGARRSRDEDHSEGTADRLVELFEAPTVEAELGHVEL